MVGGHHQIPVEVVHVGAEEQLDAELGRPAPSLLEVGRDLEPHLRELLAFQPFEQSPDLHAGVAAPEELPDTPTITYGLTG